MSAWIPSFQSLATHRRLFALSRILSLTRRDCIGLLHLLWWWALDNAPTGDLSAIDAQDIARVVDFDGDGRVLMRALIASGFVTESGALHDWDDYAGKLFLQRLANAEKQRQHRQKQRLLLPSASSQLRNDDVTVTLPLRNALEKSRVQESTEEKNNGPGPSEKNSIFDAFEQLTARPCTPFESEKLTDLEKEHGNEHTLAAIAEAGDNNARSIRYIETVLESWRANGYDKTKSGGKQNGRNSGRNKQLSKGVRQLPPRESYTTPEQFRAAGQANAAGSQ